jgi:hypothetical protein
MEYLLNQLNPICHKYKPQQPMEFSDSNWGIALLCAGRHTYEQNPKYNGFKSW